MLPLTDGELESMREPQLDSMIDECVHVIYANTGDNPLGEPTEGYTDGVTMACSFAPISQREVSEGSDLVTLTATARVPMTATFKARDRFRLTKIAREALDTPQTYEVIGVAQHRKTTFVLDLRFIGAT